VLGTDKRLVRWTTSAEIVRLAEERQLHWAQLRELAGVVVAEPTRERVRASLEAELEGKLAAARAEYEAKLAEVEATYPVAIARRLAEGLLRASRTGQTVRELLANLPETGGATSTMAPSPTPRSEGVGSGEWGGGATGVPASHGASAATSAAAAAVTVQVPSPITSPASGSAPAAAPAVTPHLPPPTQPASNGSATAVASADTVSIEAYIDSERCTTCNECINLNKKMFAYNADKQAYVKDASAGTFAQLVQAAEKCPVSAIHPGTPVNPKEKDLEKWLKRAQAF
jgi:ferredoxin